MNTVNKFGQLYNKGLEIDRTYKDVSESEDTKAIRAYIKRLQKFESELRRCITSKSRVSAEESKKIHGHIKTLINNLENKLKEQEGYESALDSMEKGIPDEIYNIIASIEKEDE